MSIIKAVRFCLETYVEPAGFLLDGGDLCRLMRRHNVTIRELSKRSGITQKRIREVRGSGLDHPGAVRDWVEHVTGKDPGQIVSAYYA